MRLIIILLLVTGTCYSQEFKKLRLAVGYGRTFDRPVEPGGTSSCSVIYLEPSYRINDRIAIGYRMEHASTMMLPMIGGGASSVSSYGLNAQYYLSNKEFRPFVGLGVGFFKPSRSYGSSGPFNPKITNEKTTFGFYPRIGFDYHHLTLNIEYNFAPASSTNVTTYEDNGQIVHVDQGELKNSYGSVKLGLVIGGGVKKNK